MSGESPSQSGAALEHGGPDTGGGEVAGQHQPSGSGADADNIGLDLRLRDPTELPEAEYGHALVRHFLHRWESDGTGAAVRRAWDRARIAEAALTGDSRRRA